VTNLVHALTRELTIPLTTLATGFKTGRILGGAGILTGEANGFAGDFMAVDPVKRVAVKVAGVVTEYAVDSFIANAGSSPKQVYGSAGTLTWVPHNLFLNSAAPVTQGVTLVAGQVYTMTVTGSGSMVGSVGASGTATEGSPATFTATTASGTFTKTGTLSTIQINRGAVATAYLATTSTVRMGVAVDAAGLLCEPQATNLLLNSTTLSTQSVTVTAAAHTLSFWGTGTITLSGTSTAGPLVGTGAANRVSLTFTPTAGSLTLTVSGSVLNAQLETGTIPTSPIPTFAATATRIADWYTFLLSSIPALGAEYSIYVQFSTPIAAANRYAFAMTDGTANELVGIRPTSSTINPTVIDGGVVQVTGFHGTVVANTPIKTAMRIKANDFATSVAGATAVADTAGTLPTLTTANLSGGTGFGNSLALYHVQQVSIVPRGLSNAELQARATP
jgi:hypothetical protein